MPRSAAAGPRQGTHPEHLQLAVQALGRQGMSSMPQGLQGLRPPLLQGLPAASAS